MNTPKHYADQFQAYLRQLGYSLSTQRMLPACIEEFIECMINNNIRELKSIKPMHVWQHYEYLCCRPNKRRQGGLSSVMINHHLLAIRSFFIYLQQLGTIDKNPVSYLYFPRPMSEPREILSVEEILRLYNSCKNLRENALLGVYYACGLRRSEGAALNLQDISIPNALLYVREGKGHKRRVVPINSTVLNDFSNYINLRHKEYDGENAFFLNASSKRASGDDLYKAFKDILVRNHISKRICLHSLRHSIATHLLENGLPVESVRDFLGHKNLESTQIYIRPNNEKIIII